MEEQKNISRYDFYEELLLLPAKCKNVTDKTARKKVKEFWNKYHDLLYYSSAYREMEEEKLLKLQNVCNSLKSGVVRFDGGFLMVSEIVKVKVDKKNDIVVVDLKNSQSVNLVMTYKWLEYLF
jgi:hypothetical protein